MKTVVKGEDDHRMHFDELGSRFEVAFCSNEGPVLIQ